MSCPMRGLCVCCTIIFPCDGGRFGRTMAPEDLTVLLTRGNLAECLSSTLQNLQVARNTT
eukprot:3800639-Amphidinium_carterae.1